MSKGLESDCINHHMSSCHRTVFMSLFFFSLVYYVFSYIFLTLMNSILLTQTSPSSIFQVFDLHVSGKFKHQGNCCHFIFALSSWNIHFTSCSDCGSEEGCWRSVSSFHIWLQPEPRIPKYSFLFLLSSAEFSLLTKQFSCRWFECLSVYSSNLHFRFLWKAISQQNTLHHSLFRSS